MVLDLRHVLKAVQAKHEPGAFPFVSGRFRLYLNQGDTYSAILAFL